MEMRKFLSILFLAVSIALNAQETRRVSATYIYHAPENVSVEQAKRTALDRARIKALADEFGTVLTQHNATVMTNENGKSATDFTSLSNSDVKGEWIETIGQPEYEVGFLDGMLTVKCTVHGKAREIKGSKTVAVAKILRNGTEDRFEDDNFTSGDDLYLSFTSPADGYLAVYLVDNDGNAFCLLPYRSSKDGRVAVKAGKRYVLFSAKDSAPLVRETDVDEYTMTCAGESETDFIYVIFSTHPFTKAADSAEFEGLPRQLTFADFQKWLARCRNHDREMTVDIKTITITKKR